MVCQFPTRVQTTLINKIKITKIPPTKFVGGILLNIFRYYAYTASILISEKNEGGCVV